MSGVPLRRLAELRVDRQRYEPDGLLTLDLIEGGTGTLLGDPWQEPAEPPDSGVADIEPGDVLFGKLRPYLAKVTHVPRTGYASTELMCLRPCEDVEPRWFFYRMVAHPTVEWSVATSEGTKMPRTSWEKLGQFRVEVPAVGRQRAIADYLDTETARIDALIAKKTVLVGKLGERSERSADTIAIPYGRPGDRQNPSDLPRQSEFPRTWRLEALGNLLRRITYGFTNPMPTSDEGPVMLTANDIGDGFIRTETARRTTRDAFDHLLTAKSRPTPGDVLLTKDGTLGRAALLERGDVCVNQSVAVLTPDRKRILPHLLAELLAVPAYRDALIFEAGGTTIKHLYISRIVKQKVALPPLEGQPALAAELQAARLAHSKTMEAVETSIRLLREHRQALIAAAVTGELDIPGVA